MTITREEFKELVDLYTEAFNKFCRVAETTLNDDFADDLIFPAFNWLEEKLNLKDPNGFLSELVAMGGAEVPTHKRDKNGDVIYRFTADLDEIYDAYLNPAAQINSIIFEQYLQDCDNPYPALLLLEEKLQEMEESIDE